jgi:hypothetical protein
MEDISYMVLIYSSEMGNKNISFRIRTGHLLKEIKFALPLEPILRQN